jgi:hypothetical protein
MTKAEEFLAQSARCTRLAENCSDPAVAAKLRQLAHYLKLAGQLSVVTSSLVRPAAAMRSPQGPEPR